MLPNGTGVGVVANLEAQMFNLKKNDDMNEKAEFAVRVLKQYALENQIPARSTSDLSQMEQWLILRLFAVIKLLPDSDEIRMKARELDEKDFDQWWWETVYKGNVYNNVRIQVQMVWSKPIKDR